MPLGDCISARAMTTQVDRNGFRLPASSVASASAANLFASKLPLLELFSTPIPDQVLENAHAKLVTSLSFNGDSSQFASGSLDKTVKVWDTVTRQPLAVFMGNMAVNAVAYSPKLPLVLSGGEERNVQAWHVPSKRMLGSVSVPTAPVHCLAFAPNGRLFAAGCAAGQLVLFAANQASSLAPSSSSSSQAPSSAASDAPLALSDLSSSSDSDADSRLIGAFGVFAPSWVIIQEHIADVRAVAFSAQSDFMLTGSDDQTIKMFSLTPHGDQPLKYQLIRTFEAHQGPVYGLSIASDSVSFLSVSKDKSCRLWHIETGSHATFEHQDELYSVAFSPDASAFLVGGLLERRFWDASKRGGLFAERRAPPALCKGVAFSSDGSLMLTSSQNSIRLTSNAHHSKTVCRFVAWHHAEISKAISNEAWRVLMDLMKQQRALLTQWEQQQQQLIASSIVSSTPSPPQLYTHIDHFVNREGVPFLHSAIHRLDVRSVRVCLELGADKNRPTRASAKTPLHVAVDSLCRQHSSHAASLLAAASVASSSASSASSSSLAAITSSPATTTASSTVSTSLESVVDTVSSMVHTATSAVAGAVGAIGATASTYTSSSAAEADPLGIATMIVSVLLDAGVNVNAQDRDGNTVLHVAVRAAIPELVTCLLLAGADASIRNKQGHSPANYARSLTTLEALLRFRREQFTSASSPPSTLVSTDAQHRVAATVPSDSSSKDSSSKDSSSSTLSQTQVSDQEAHQQRVTQLEAHVMQLTLDLADSHRALAVLASQMEKLQQ